MPDEPIAAAADLGAASPAANVPAPAASPAAPQQLSGDPATQGYQTDDQILGIDPVGASPAQEPAEPVPETEQKPADPNAPKPAPTPEQEAAAKVEEDGRLMPVKWRELAKSDPEFRTLFYTNRANVEKLATMEPKFAEAQTALAEVERADTAWLSGDPAAIQTELKSFLGEKPDALVPMFQAGEQLLKQMLPEQHARMQADRITEGLRSQNFETAFQVLRQAIESKNPELLSAQVEKILDWAGKNGFPTTESERLAARAAELDARDATHAANEQRSYLSTQETFRSAVNTEMETAIKGEIKTSLDKLLEKSAFTAGARGRIDAEVLAETYKMLSANKEIPDALNKLLFPNGFKDAAGKQQRAVFNDATRKAAIDAPVSYARTILQDVIKRVVENYTTDFMAADQNRNARSAAAGAKTDVSGGNLQQREPRPLTKKDIDYSKQTDEDILGL